LHSKQTGRDYELIIQFPSSYKNSPGKRYPVLYFADGYWDTPLLSATYGNFMYDNVAPEFIMVGLSYPGRNVNYDRLRRYDLTPTEVSTENNPTGGAAKFLAFIKQDVVPLMEKKYRADPKQRVLSGVSLGGLFTLYAMYQDPEYFGRYVALSPAIHWDKNYIVSVDNQYASAHRELNARLFLSYGTGEYAPYREPIADFQQQLQKRNYQGLALKNYQMEGLRHVSEKGEGYAHGLIWVFKDIAPTGPSGLEKGLRGIK